MYHKDIIMQIQEEKYTLILTRKLKTLGSTQKSTLNNDGYLSNEGASSGWIRLPFQISKYYPAVINQP